MEERLKRLLEELGAAMNDSLSESKPIAEGIAKIRVGGYDVFVVLSPIKKHEEEQVKEGILTKSAVKPGFTPRDIKFLKSMHISADRRRNSDTDQ